MLTKRAIELLRLMAEAEAREDYEGAEIVCDGLWCYLGEQAVSRRTVNVLLRHVAVSMASEPGSTERYVLSGSGRKMAGDPAVADRVMTALLSGTPCDSEGNPLDPEGLLLSR